MEVGNLGLTTAVCQGGACERVGWCGSGLDCCESRLEERVGMLYK